MNLLIYESYKYQNIQLGPGYTGADITNSISRDTCRPLEQAESESGRAFCR